VALCVARELPVRLSIAPQQSSGAARIQCTRAIVPQALTPAGAGTHAGASSEQIFVLRKQTKIQ
jgi:hypothetical protein